jgi:hypothetical protein
MHPKRNITVENVMIAESASASALGGYLDTICAAGNQDGNLTQTKRELICSYLATKKGLMSSTTW